MLLHQQLNNEALDEDYKQRDRVIKMLKRNELIEENKDLKPDLTARENSIFNLSLLNLNKEVEGILEDDIEEKSLGKVPFLYDRLCQTILSLKLNDKSNKDREKIYQILDESLLPKLDELEYKVEQLDFPEGYIVPFIIDNIKNRKFNQILTNKNLIKKYVETAQNRTNRQIIEKLNRDYPYQPDDEDEYDDMPPLEEDNGDDDDMPPLEDDRGFLYYDD